MSTLDTTSTHHPHADIRTPFVSAVPLTPGELAAAPGRWQRRGLLQRLVRVN